MLEQYIRDRLKEKDILLMTHIVMGYPSFDASLDVVETMAKAGVDLMELQIPFSEPIADGPVILAANQKSLEGGATVRRCMDFAREAARRFDIPFLFMSYYNILHRYGVARFAGAMAESRMRGAIVPDLPPEEGGEYTAAMADRNLDPIYIYAPTTPPDRMAYIDGFARGFIYCVARKGVTGAETDFSTDLERYLARCRQATRLPLAVGFGVKSRADVDFLKGKADIAVVGSQTIRLMDREGTGAVDGFIRSLR
ncbi:tryptophan synthase subunit alpha [Desulfococcus sp.]|uniref:tryptophan synthase subunit alpha n=1 Tax=Desulfococcus sp. TaxID=2025834 RepID=UPI003593E294